MSQFNYTNNWFDNAKSTWDQIIPTISPHSQISTVEK